MRLEFKSCLGPCFHAAGLYFSRAHPPHLSHDGFTASGFHFKDVMFVVLYYILLFDYLNYLLTYLCDQIIKLLTG